MLEIVWAFIKGARNIFIPVGVGIVAFILGLIIGSYSVDFVDAGPDTLRSDYQTIYLQAVAMAAEANPNLDIPPLLGSWDEANRNAAICAAQDSREANGDTVSAAQLGNLASRLSVNCDALTPVEEGGSLLNTLILLFLLAVVLGAIFLILRSRGAAEAPVDYDFGSRTQSAPVPDEAPVSVDMGSAGDVGGPDGFTPIASYRTTYSRGIDNYDDSFSIENASGDFLGECGVGISESIGMDSPKNVTAMEIWLFDKNDIRTITKVAMSDHAFFEDEAIKAKLAPKGEPVLARLGEVIVLETASLIINAKITSLDYGSDPGLPDKSFFDSFGVELSAWSKDGAPAGGGELNFEDML